MMGSDPRLPRAPGGRGSGRYSAADLDALMDGCEPRLLVDRDTRVRYASPALAALLGHRSAELARRTLVQLVAPEHLSLVLRELAGRDQLPATARVHLRRADGSAYPCRLAGRFIPASGLWALEVLPVDSSRSAPEALAGRLASDELLLRVAARFLDPAATLDAAIDAAMADVVEHLGADRAGLVVVEAAAPHEVRHRRWSCRDGVLPPRYEIPLWLRETLAGATELCTLRVDDPAELGPHLERFTALGVKSVLSVRLPLGDGTVCALTATMLWGYRRWSDEDLHVLQTAAGLVGNAIRRAGTERSVVAQRDELVASEARLRTVLDTAPAVIFRLDRDTTILLCNPEAARFGVIEPAQLVGLRLTSFLHGALLDAFVSGCERVFVHGEAVDSVLPVTTPKGTFWFDCRGVPEYGADGTVQSMLLFAVDVTERRKMEEQIRHAASVDALTGLANRRVLLDHLARQLDQRVAGGPLLAVLFVDLDRFKLTNDSLGHAAGDALLCSVAGVLSRAVREDDLVARLGGDEFAVSLAGLRDMVETIDLVERIRGAIATPVAIEGHLVTPTVSIGVAFAGDADHQPADLLRLADLAMYQAKLRGRNRFEIFDDNLRTDVDERVLTEAALRLALPRNELEVHYQPEVWLGTGELSALEALVRWRHPVRGLLPAGAFIDVAEDSGLIGEIGAFVLHEACRQAAEWQRATPARPLILRVNVSGRQLVQPMMLRQIATALAQSDLAPEQLCLEITATALLSDPETTTQMLRWIRDLGVRLAIDDFGTGYSSLGYLGRFPVDTLKIDRSFIAGLGNDTNLAIVRTLVDLAAALDLEVVAEGVETEVQAGILRTLGCQRAQGYLFAPALPAAEVAVLLARGVFDGAASRR